MMHLLLYNDKCWVAYWHQLTSQSNVFCIIWCALGNELLTRDAGEGRVDAMRADGSYDGGTESDVIVIWSIDAVDWFVIVGL